MATVVPRGENRWLVRVFLGHDPSGQVIRPSKTITARGIRQAKAKAAEWERELVEAGAVDNYRDRQDRTVADAVDAWLTSRERLGRAATTMREYRRHGTEIKKALGRRKLSELSLDDIEGHYDQVTRAGQKVHHRHTALVGVLQEAVLRRWTTVNMAKLTRRESKRKFHPNVPTPADLELLFKTADRHPWFGRLVRFAAATGMRRGELAAMQFSGFDRQRGVYTVAHSVATVGGGTVLKDTKTHQVRHVALSDPLLAIVEEQVRFLQDRAALTGRELTADPYLWSHDVDGAGPPHPDTITGQFRRTARAAGVDCRFHDLRHGFATWLLNTVSWEQLPTVSRMLGHASPATTSRIYAHGVTAAERGLADRIGRMVAGELEA